MSNDDIFEIASRVLELAQGTVPGPWRADTDIDEDTGEVDWTGKFHVPEGEGILGDGSRGGDTWVTYMCEGPRHMATVKAVAEYSYAAPKLAQAVLNARNILVQHNDQFNAIGDLIMLLSKKIAVLQKAEDFSRMPAKPALQVNSAGRVLCLCPRCGQSHEELKANLVQPAVGGCMAQLTKETVR